MAPPQIVERSFSQDVSKAYRPDRPLDAAALNQVGDRGGGAPGASLPPACLAHPGQVIRWPPACPPSAQVIAEHLFHEGLFDIGRAFVGEAGVPGGDALQRPYASMHGVLQEVGGGGRGCAGFGAVS